MNSKPERWQLKGKVEPGKPNTGATDSNGAGTPSPAVPPPPSDPRPRLTPNQRAWRRFRQNRLTLASGFFLVAFTLLLLVWPLFDLPGIAPRLFKAMTWSPTTL